MTTNEVIQKLRMEKGLTQEELAEHVFVTRQAVSRWETGETVPNTETLKLLSKLFEVSVNTLLGEPLRLICQCCGMPLDDTLMSREPDGTINEAYCRWCYHDGKFAYESMEQLTEFLANHLSDGQTSPEQIRAHLRELLPALRHWQKSE